MDMELFVFNLMILVIVLCVLYFLIKAAVRDGMLEYDRIRREQDAAPVQPEDGGSPVPSETIQEIKTTSKLVVCSDPRGVSTC